MSTRSSQPRQPVYRQRSIDGLYTIDPGEIDQAGLQHISQDPYPYKQVRPQTNEGLQAGIPTKHLASLQAHLHDDPQVIEDNTHLQPAYFERDFKKWQTPEPIRVLGLRRRVFWGVLAIIILILAATTIGVAVGLTSAQRAEQAKADASASALALSRSTNVLFAATPTTAITSLINTTAQIPSTITSATTAKPTTYAVDSTGVWSETLQTVPIFSGSLIHGATPSYFTTATISAPRHDPTAGTTGDVGRLGLIDCPTKNNTVFNSSNNVKYRKLCYTAMQGLQIYHKTIKETFDDCIESCALAFAGVQATENSYQCKTVTWTANLTLTTDMQTGASGWGSNCFFYSTTGEGSPGEFMTASAVFLENDSLPPGVSG